MWYPASIVTPAAGEPVTADQVKAQCRIDDTASDTLITRLIAVARAAVEARCGTRLVQQTISAKCDRFEDLARLPFGPVKSITSINYVDADGTEQTVATTVYEARIDGLDAAIVLKRDQSWPSIGFNSRITVVAVVGYETIPPDLTHAMLLLIGGWFENREESVIGVTVDNLPDSLSVDSLLINHRLGV